ncbi:zinc-binding protein A33-like [Eucyclogobius newberryi]|uniref:zinc-binding protein A33-like n=1 Tax=Eucyclogobius newberryi TaxID=166745 RepID=UPI003B5CBC5C
MINRFIVAALVFLVNTSHSSKVLVSTTSPAAKTTGAPQNGQRDPRSGPVTPKAAPRQEHESHFETPLQTSHRSAAEENQTRRALDFSTGARQFQRDQVKAELRQKIRCREQKLCEIRSCVKACKGGLDAEWLEIDGVFSSVIHIVEEARRRALQPLEKRREKLKKDSRSLIQKIQEEIVKLEQSIEEVDNAADLDIVPLSKLKLRDFTKVGVDTSYAFGTLQTTLSTMKEQIQEEVDKLSALELERAPVFAVDVELDPRTAHQWLLVSKDRKSVQDGGQSQQLPCSAGRFDTFGSILGAGPFSSRGRGYWEVRVGGKSGWDLGVASAKANRKGKLTLSPDNGYWAIVHFEGDKYAALTAPPVCVELKRTPQRVGLFLDYDEGLLSFYDVDNQTHIYSFTKCSFNDEIFPYFSPHLKQDGKNAEPLVIAQVKN